MQPWHLPRVMTLSPKWPEAPGSLDELQPQIIQLCQRQQVLGGSGRPRERAVGGPSTGEQPRPRSFAAASYWHAWMR